MEILKLSKTKSDCYNLELSNNEVLKLHEDIIIKYRLTKGKIIDLDLIDILIQEQLYFSFYNKAISYSLKGMKSKFQIKHYLITKECPKEYIDQIIDKLYDLKLINDLKYANTYANQLIKKSYGKKMIEAKLSQIGISSEIINEILISFDNEMYLDYAKIIVVKQRKNYKKYDLKEQNNKLVKYLIQRGYSTDIAFKAIV